MTSKEIMTINNNFPSQVELQNVSMIARTAHASGMYSGVGGEAKIMMILLAAKELGIGPCIALNGGIWSIQGKIEISARLMNSMIRRSGHTMKITSTATECTIQGKRSDTGEEHTETFTMQMAVTAGLAGGNVWKKYPEDMLYNRCMSRLARRLFPDVIGTAYVENEIKDAIEIEKKEKELQQAQYEDVTPSESSHKTSELQHIDNIATQPTPPEKPALINQEQLDALLDLLPKASEEWRKNLWEHLKGINVFCEKDIPQYKYKGIITSIELNIANKDRLAS